MVEAQTTAINVAVSYTYIDIFYHKHHHILSIYIYIHPIPDTPRREYLPTFPIVHVANFHLL